MNAPGFPFLAMNHRIASNNISEDSKGANCRGVFCVAAHVNMSI